MHVLVLSYSRIANLLMAGMTSSDMSLGAADNVSSASVSSGSTSGSTEHLQFVSTSGVINRLVSFHQPFSGESLELFLVNSLYISDTLNHRRTCHFLCVKDNQIHTLFLEVVVKLFHHTNKGANIFGE